MRAQPMPHNTSPAKPLVVAETTISETDSPVVTEFPILRPPTSTPSHWKYSPMCMVFDKPRSEGCLLKGFGSVLLSIGGFLNYNVRVCLNKGFDLGLDCVPFCPVNIFDCQNQHCIFCQGSSVGTCQEPSYYISCRAQGQPCTTEPGIKGNLGIGIQEFQHPVPVNSCVLADLCPIRVVNRDF